MSKQVLLQFECFPMITSVWIYGMTHKASRNTEKGDLLFFRSSIKVTQAEKIKELALITAFLDDSFNLNWQSNGMTHMAYRSMEDVPVHYYNPTDVYYTVMH